MSGGALVENKRIRHGAHLLAGEVGYLLLGQEMTVSQAVSPVSLAKRYNTKTGRNISGKEVFERAQAGDEVAQAEVEQAMQTLATLLYDLQYSFDPELFIIGGAISKNEQLLPLLRAHLAKIKEHVEIADVMPEITVCKYHEQANLLGAAINFEHKMEAWKLCIHFQRISFGEQRHLVHNQKVTLKNAIKMFLTIGMRKIQMNFTLA